MAVYRMIHISFWQDSFVLDLTPEEKYFYIYLMTNSKTNQVGCYEIPKKVIEMETGYNRETVEKLIGRFEEYGKIKYSDNEMLLVNWHKYSWSKSPKVISCIKSEYESVKNPEFKRYLSGLFNGYGYSIDSLLIDYGEKEKEKEKEKKEEKEIEKEIYKNVVDYLNQKTSSNFKSSSKTTQKHINARLKDGYNIDDFKTVIDKKVIEWKDDPKMSQYLRPETLFGSKFEGYLNQKEVRPQKFTNKFNNFDQRDYGDMSELEQKLLGRQQ